MNLEKAIEILNEHYHNYAIFHLPDLDDAVLLGIEALKRCKLVGRYTYGAGVNLLPGETKEYIPRDVSKLPSDEDYEKGG